MSGLKSIFLIFTIASFTVLLFGQAVLPAFADVSSPNKQIKIGIEGEDIICKADLIKVYRPNNESFDCFTPSTAEKLIDRGMAKEIPKDKLEAKKSFRQNSPIGTVTELSVTKVFADAGRLESNPRVAEYMYIFEVCAMDKTIRAPEVLITSDSETKKVKLAQKIMADRCYTSSAKIKASNTVSISASLTNKGLITDKLTELEMKVADIQQKLRVMKDALSETVKQGATSLDDEGKKKVSETTTEISKLRSDLNLAKGDLNKYLFALHAPKQLKASEFTKQQMTFTGMPLKDTSANVMSVTKQISGTKNQDPTFGNLNLYNVVFETCAGVEQLRTPEVRVTSDSEEKNIRVSEKIISNSCLMSTAKINAKDTSSIMLEVLNRSDISVKITELENKIDALIGKQIGHQTELNKLVVQSEKPADYEKKITDLSNKIIQLRDEIRDAKFQLHGMVYEVYKKQ